MSTPFIRTPGVPVTAGLRLAFLASGLALATGCQRPDAEAAQRAGQSDARFRRSVIGKSVEGRPIECEIIGDGPDVVLIIATIHGDEPAGTPLVERLSHYLRNDTLAREIVAGRRIVIVPVANPDGLAKNLRHNVRDVDLNRNFPATNFGVSQRHGENPLSEPESRALYRVMREHQPDRIVSIHQPRTLPACIDYDGPAKVLAAEMARHTDLPVKKLGSRPGSLGAYAGETLGTPIITLEIPRSRDDGDGDALWRRYGRMILSAICYPDTGLPATLP